MITTENEYKSSKEAYLCIEKILHQFESMPSNPKLESTQMKTMRHQMMVSRDHLLKELRTYEAIPKETSLCL